jgi:CRISPR-associated endoribonuclease Cas6
MLRIRIILPKQQSVQYQYLDILHDALVNAWIAAGADRKQILYENALPWNFAALGGHHKDANRVHSLVVSTPDADLAEVLRNLNPDEITYARASTVERVKFAGAEVVVEDNPIFPKQNILGVLMLSPLVISDRQGKSKGRRWHKDLAKVDLSSAINFRLSRLAGREIKLDVQVDSLYLRCNPEHSVLVPNKLRNGKKVFVIGMNAPLILAGSEEDLRFAWYAGIGEKTRNGFGCIGLAEEGVGR